MLSLSSAVVAWKAFSRDADTAWLTQAHNLVTLQCTPVTAGQKPLLSQKRRCQRERQRAGVKRARKIKGRRNTRPNKTLLQSAGRNGGPFSSSVGWGGGGRGEVKVASLCSDLIFETTPSNVSV